MIFLFISLCISFYNFPSNISKNYYLELNQDGTTSDITTGLSKEEQQIIHEYLDQNKDVYADLIEKTLGKKLELSS